MGFLGGGSDGKEFAYNAGDPGLIPGLRRSSGEGNGPLHYSCLENPMDKGAWQATVRGVTRVGHDLMTKPPVFNLCNYFPHTQPIFSSSKTVTSFPH